MKAAGTLLIFAASAGLFFAAAGGRAENVPVAGNPYAPVVERNVFGLLPPPTNDPAANLPPPEPPPKITPNGIMSIFGRLQVLFKVAVKPLPGQPQKDASYVMSEGERQDDITVTKIDDAAGVVIFDNHGTVQELALVATPATGGAGSAPGGGIAAPPLPNNISARTLGAPVSPGGFSRGQKVATGGNPQASGLPMNLFGGGATGGNNSAPTEKLSPEAQVILMEAQRAKWKSEGNPAAAIIPPTPLTHLLNPPAP